jgi:hypothetical protein
MENFLTNWVTYLPKNDFLTRSELLNKLVSLFLFHCTLFFLKIPPVEFTVCYICIHSNSHKKSIERFLKIFNTSTVVLLSKFLDLVFKLFSVI